MAHDHRAGPACGRTKHVGAQHHAVVHFDRHIPFDDHVVAPFGPVCARRNRGLVDDTHRCCRSRVLGACHCGSSLSLVSRPMATASRLSNAKQVMTPAALLKLPPNGATSRPATSGPKLVMIRPVPLQNDSAVARTWVGKSSGK